MIDARRGAGAYLFVLVLSGCTQPVLAPSAGTAPAAPPTAAAPVRLTVAYSSLEPSALPIWIAAEAGVYAKHGLEVDLQNMASSTATAALVSGQVQVTVAGGSGVLGAVANGADLVVIGTMSPVYAYKFFVPASIAGPDQLKGAKVGVSQFGDATDTAARLGLAKIGLDPNRDVTFVAVGSHDNRTAGLLNGSIQGGVDNPPGSLTLEANGFHALFDLAAMRVPTANFVLTVQRAYLDANRDSLQHYVDALVDGAALVKHDRAAAVRTLMKYFKTTDEQAMNVTYDYYVQNVIPAFPHARPDQFADVVAVLAEQQPRVRQIDFDKLLDDSFIQHAEQQGTKPQSRSGY